MALSSKKAITNQRYRDKYEYITTRVSAVEKQTIIEHAESMGESLNTFMRRAAFETIKYDLTSVMSKTDTTT